MSRKNDFIIEYEFEYLKEYTGDDTDVEIPNTVTRIGAHAFDGCTSIKSITIPDSVTEICAYAFNNCINLESIIIPNSMELIGESAFYGCTSLKSITLPDDLKLVDRYAFKGCTSLESITISDPILQYYLFVGCSGFTVFLPDTMTSIDELTFSKTADVKLIGYGLNAKKLSTNMRYYATLGYVFADKNLIGN